MKLGVYELDSFKLGSIVNKIELIFKTTAVASSSIYSPWWHIMTGLNCDDILTTTESQLTE